MFLDHGFPGYQHVQSPTINCVAEIAKDLNIDLNENELKEYHGVYYYNGGLYVVYVEAMF